MTQGLGLTPFGAASAASVYPVDLWPALREHDLGEEALFLAFELSRYPPALEPPERRALLFLALASVVSVRDGSTRLPLGDAARDLLRSLGASEESLDLAFRLVAEERAARASGRAGRLSSVLGLPGEEKPLLLEGDCLYQHRMLHHEERVAAAIAARLRRPAAIVAVDAALGAVLARPPEPQGNPVKLSEEQERAVRAALSLPLSVVTGGPGTGKTAIVVTLLRALARLETPLEAIALAAPTGKAAYRMRESVLAALWAIPRRDEADERLLTAIPEARTLHRLLGYSPRTGTFRHHENNRLVEEVVVVDEASMVDLFLMDRLARSLRDDARLVLLGDAEQLPSVDAGAVLRDLLPGEEAEDPRRGAAVRLTHSFRVDPTDPTGRLILTVASAINEGRVDRLLEAESRSLASRASPAEIAFRGVELLEGAGARPAFLDRWYVERVHGEAWVEELRRQTFRHTDASFDERSRRDLERLFAHFEGARLLCVTRGEHTPTGAAHVNALLHAKAARAAGVAGASDLLPGEPVLVLENDYERGLFNGDQGIILWVRAEGAGERAYPMAVFRGRGGFAAFPLGALRPKLGLAYATTVHKSQGAEFDFVALLLPERDLPLCTRELLYTAVTRARRSVVLVGSREILASGARRRLLRFSGVGEKIARMSPCAARGPEARSESWTG